MHRIVGTDNYQGQLTSEISVLLAEHQKEQEHKQNHNNNNKNSSVKCGQRDHL